MASYSTQNKFQTFYQRLLVSLYSSYLIFYQSFSQYMPASTTFLFLENTKLWDFWENQELFTCVHSLRNVLTPVFLTTVSHILFRFQLEYLLLRDAFLGTFSEQSFPFLHHSIILLYNFLHNLSQKEMILKICICLFTILCLLPLGDSFPSAQTFVGHI